MTHHRLNELLPQINPGIEVRRYHQRHGQNDGVYYKGKYICAVPQGYIAQVEMSDYMEHVWEQIAHRSVDNLARLLINEGVIASRDYFTLMRG